MKILIIHQSDKSIGGIRTYTDKIKKGLIRAGCEVEVVLVPEHYFEYKNRWLRFLSGNLINIKLYRHIRRIIKDYNPDVIQFSNIDRSLKTFLLASVGYKKIKIVHDFGIINPWHDVIFNNKNMIDSSGNYYSVTTRMLLGRLFDYYVFNNTFWYKLFIEVFICPSKALFLQMKKKGFKEVYYLPHPVELTEKVGMITSPQILYVGRLVEQKGLSYLLEAFSVLAKKNDTIRLVVLGSGVDDKIFRSYAKKLGISNRVDFMGEVPRGELGAYYERSLMVVVPSVWLENYPNVIYEAMYYAVPVVATKVGGIPELVVNGVNGLLVKPYSSWELANAIQRLIDNPEEAKNMGMNGHERIRDFMKVGEYIDKLMMIYKQ